MRGKDVGYRADCDDAPAASRTACDASAPDGDFDSIPLNPGNVLGIATRSTSGNAAGNAIGNTGPYCLVSAGYCG